MNCKEFNENISLYIDKQLSTTDKYKFENHLENCLDCKKAYIEMINIMDALKEIEEKPLPSNYNETLRMKLEKENENKNLNNRHSYRKYIALAAGLTIIVTSVSIFKFNVKEDNKIAYNLNPKKYVSQENIDNTKQEANNKKTNEVEKNDNKINENVNLKNDNIENNTVVMNNEKNIKSNKNENKNANTNKNINKNKDKFLAMNSNENEQIQTKDMTNNNYNAYNDSQNQNENTSADSMPKNIMPMSNPIENNADTNNEKNMNVRTLEATPKVASNLNEVKSTDVGGIIQIQLKENKDNGYVWRYTIDNNDIISLDTEESISNSHTWKFKALKEGKINIKYELIKENNVYEKHEYIIDVGSKK